MIINIRVQPGAKKKMIKEENGVLKVYLSAPPVEDKANKALIEALAEHFGVKKRQIIIKSGERSRNKSIEII